MKNPTMDKNKILNFVDHSSPCKGQDHQEDRLLQFVATMVHDLQGPFVSMKTLLKIFRSGNFDYKNNTHMDLLNSSLIALERSETIVHDLIDAARTETTGLPLDLVFLPIDEQIQNSIDMLKATAFDYGVEIKQELKAGSKARFDRNMLLRVMDNLIFNAIKHSGRGNDICVESAVSGENIIVKVSDRGSGLDGVNFDDLFDKYKQSALKSQGNYSGVGIGLYFCRLAIEAMGGRIWADKNPGGGAVIGYSLIKDRRGI